MTVYPDENSTTLVRAQGCLIGQLAGDALGSLVEFQSPEEIRRSYPEGVRELADGGTWNTIAGQPTDDSEMSLLLARMFRQLLFHPSCRSLYGGNDTVSQSISLVERGRRGRSRNAARRFTARSTIWGVEFFSQRF